MDGSVPQAKVEISGAREENGIRYGNGNVYVQIRIPEDGGSGIKSARYFMAVSGKALPAQVPESREWWQDCTNGMQLQLAQQGTYVVYVETEDQTGNKAYTKSEEIRIDTEKPAIKIGGVKDNSANGGEVCLTVDCQDENYRSGSLKVEISGTNGTFVPVQNENQETEQGAWMAFADFEHVKAADDIYTVCASAEDLAGNRTETSITFSVNRFGSVYDLDSDTKQELKKYYHRQPFAVTFLETNLDYVGSVQILCKREGLVTELVENRDYFASCSETENGWKQYSYRIPAKTFQKEGSYEVLLLSRDRAENSSDSRVQEKEVRFTIDRSAPDCLITGLEAGKIYQTDVLWACLEPRDNICLKEMRVYLDGKRAAEYSGEELQKMGGLIKWKAEAKEQWQRLQVLVTDAAGNQMWTEEIPFYVTGKETLETILPYEKVEKSARELEESRLSLEMLKKKTGEYGMGNVVTQEKKDEIAAAVYVSRGNSNGKKAVIGTAVRGILKQIFVTKTVFLLVGSLGLVFLLLSVSIRHFRRKR